MGKEVEVIFLHRDLTGSNLSVNTEHSSHDHSVPSALSIYVHVCVSEEMFVLTFACV